MKEIQCLVVDQYCVKLYTVMRLEIKSQRAMECDKCVCYLWLYHIHVTHMYTILT